MAVKGGITVRVQGVDKLVAKLRAVKGAVTADETLMKALEEAAKPMKAAASAKAPRRTGHLSQSIVIERVGAARGTDQTDLVVSRTGGGGFRGVGVFAAPGQGLGSRRAFYGMFQEFGTAHHAAQPFMRPAFDENKGKAVRIVRHELRAALRGAVR